MPNFCCMRVAPLPVTKLDMNMQMLVYIYINILGFASFGRCGFLGHVTLLQSSWTLQLLLLVAQDAPATLLEAVTAALGTTEDAASAASGAT